MGCSVGVGLRAYKRAGERPGFAVPGMTGSPRGAAAGAGVIRGPIYSVEMLLRRPRLWLVALALWAGQARAADDSIMLSHQGVERTAVLRRPDGNGARPVVIALHG